MMVVLKYSTTKHHYRRIQIWLTFISVFKTPPVYHLNLRQGILSIYSTQASRLHSHTVPYIQLTLLTATYSILGCNVALQIH